MKNLALLVSFCAVLGLGSAVYAEEPHEATPAEHNEAEAAKTGEHHHHHHHGKHHHHGADHHGADHHEAAKSEEAKK